MANVDVQFEVMKGLRATRVDGPESLLRQGEYYVTTSPGYKALIINCPNCRASLLIPKGTIYKTASWLMRLLGVNRGLHLAKTKCYLCAHEFFIRDSEIVLSKGATPKIT